MGPGGGWRVDSRSALWVGVGPFLGCSWLRGLFLSVLLVVWGDLVP